METTKIIEQFLIGVTGVNHEDPTNRNLVTSAEFEVLGVYQHLNNIKKVELKYNNDSKFRNLVNEAKGSEEYRPLAMVELELEVDEDFEVIEYEVLKYIGVFLGGWIENGVQEPVVMDCAEWDERVILDVALGGHLLYQ